MLCFRENQSFAGSPFYFHTLQKLSLERDPNRAQGQDQGIAGLRIPLECEESQDPYSSVRC